MITALYSVYEDDTVLRESMQSVRPHADQIIVADGPYQSFPHDTVSSTDNTLEIAEEYADIVFTPNRAWMGEAEKRNFLLSFVPRGTWAFKVDADEVVDYWNNDVFNCDAGVIMPLMVDEWRDGKTHKHYVHSFFRRTRGVSYRHRDGLYKHGTAINKAEPVKKTSRIRIRHRRDERRPVREQRKVEYRRRVREEGAD